VNGSELCKLLRKQPLKKSWVEDVSGKEREKVALRREKEPYIRESSHTR